MKIARSKLTGSSPPTSTVNLNAKDLLPLQTAIQKSRLYRKEAKFQVEHDGVKNRQACVLPTF